MGIENTTLRKIILVQGACEEGARKVRGRCEEGAGKVQGRTEEVVQKIVGFSS